MYLWRLMEWGLYTWVGFSLFLCLYYLVIFGRLALYKTSNKAAVPLPPLSVVICARNEESNLRKNLPAILQQHYSADFEVIVVDDHSNDGTFDVLRELQLKYAHLKPRRFLADKKYGGKKEALAFGIGLSQYDHLVFTDADCQPQDNLWLSRMASQFSEKKLVLGYGGHYRKVGWVNKLVRWETLQVAAQYMSLALWGKPYMGVGRNLAYHKQLFAEANGFESHKHLRSGDDDLFVSQVGQAGNTAICVDESSFTWSEGPSGFAQWWLQKRRHLSTGTFYKRHSQLVLSLYTLSTLTFYEGVLIGILGYWPLEVWLGVTLVKLTMQLLVFIPLARRFKSAETLWLFPLWEFLTTVFLTCVHLQNRFFGNPERWK